MKIVAAPKIEIKNDWIQTLHSNKVARPYLLLRKTFEVSGLPATFDLAVASSLCTILQRPSVFFFLLISLPELMFAEKRPDFEGPVG
jgi:hypothetical protein